MRMSPSFSTTKSRVASPGAKVRKTGSLKAVEMVSSFTPVAGGGASEVVGSELQLAPVRKAATAKPAHPLKSIVLR
jgi:hypothetical protein